MSRLSRREFLSQSKQAGLGAAAAAVFTSKTSAKPTSPNADIEESHLSTLYSHYGNISYRVGGRKLIVDPKTETFTNSPQGNALLKREYRKPYVIPEQV